MARAVVYWLYDDTCTDPRFDGWIGATSNWTRRLWRHRNDGLLPTVDFKFKFLFRGTMKQCLKIERTLRPTPNISWNKYPGGALGHASKGVPKSPEQRKRMRQAALDRYKDSYQHEFTSRTVKKGLKGIDRFGANNPRFGAHLSEETKQKIRDKIDERGGLSGKNNPNYRHGEYSKE